MENLVMAWDEFKKSKTGKLDVQVFEFELEKNLFELHRELKEKKYSHGPYSSFYIRDPKVRHIHKATVRDRVLHHAVYRVVNPIFESTFIPNSFSCRVNKGTHKGVSAALYMVRKVSKNWASGCYVLKCDVRKFFDSIDHETLLRMLKRRIVDPDTRWLMEKIVHSFSSGWVDLFTRHGLPIGNLTSQLFANIYMNEFDQFMKHELKVKYYARYTDDFMIVSADRRYLESLIGPIKEFLRTNLKVDLHPKKVSIRKYHQGIDFLGYVILPHCLLLRNKTKRRLFRRLKRQINECKQGKRSAENVEQSLQSYLGVLSHANAHDLAEELKNKYWFWMKE